MTASESKEDHLAGQDANYMGRSGKRQLMIRGKDSLSAMAAGGMTGGRVTHAEAISDAAAIPVVKRLTVSVVTDSYHHAFEREINSGSIRVRRFGFDVAPGREPTRTLQNEWGLSLHVRSERDTETRNLLIDFGYTANTLLNNLAVLGIDTSEIDAMVLSHGHVDHFGGLAGFLSANKGRLRTGLPLFVGGEECFCARDIMVPGSTGYFGALDRAAIRNAGLMVTFAEAPSLIAGHGFTTGQIPLRSFERVLAPTRMTSGFPESDDAGAAIARELNPLRPGRPDDFVHEIATAYNVHGRGLVVITSCGHRGVVNSVRAAIEVSGIHRILAVIGGFHLAPYPAEYQLSSARALLELDPEFIVPMHCSGEDFIRIVSAEMPGRFIRSSTGSQITFGP